MDFDVVKSNIDSNGFHVERALVDAHQVSQMRNFWVDFFTENKVPNKTYVGGDFFYGEPNFLSYSGSPRWKLFRHYDFLWNKQTHSLTTKTCINLHKIRNKLQCLPEQSGLLFNELNYGVYISTSHYPGNGGMLRAHKDAPASANEIHFMLPLTFLGKDFNSGGLFVVDEGGNKVIIDELCEPGDVIFFKGMKTHGVEAVFSDGIGRIAVFAVPTLFTTSWKFRVFGRTTFLWLRDMATRSIFFKTLKYLRGLRK